MGARSSYLWAAKSSYPLGSKVFIPPGRPGLHTSLAAKSSYPLSAKSSYPFVARVFIPLEALGLHTFGSRAFCRSELGWAPAWPFVVAGRPLGASTLGQAAGQSDTGEGPKGRVGRASPEQAGPLPRRGTTEILIRLRSGIASWRPLFFANVLRRSVGRPLQESAVLQPTILPQRGVNIRRPHPETSGRGKPATVTTSPGFRSAVGTSKHVRSETPTFQGAKYARYTRHFRSRGLRSTAPAHQIRQALNKDPAARDQLSPSPDN